MKSKLLAILGLVLTMGVTACNGETVESKENSQPQVSSASSKSTEQSSIVTTSSVSSAQATSSIALSSSQTVSSSTHVHNYGTLNEGFLPSYYYDGMKPYYYCIECGQYFDANKNPVTEASLKLPKATDDIAFLVDGNEKETFELVEKTENVVSWKLIDCGIDKNSVLAIAKPGDPTYKYGFFRGNNIDENNKPTIEGRLDIFLVATPNGFQLSVEEHASLVVRVNNTDYPMHKTTYYQSNITTYIYGYHNIVAGDKLTVIDTSTNIVYDYDDLENYVKWNKFDFHKGSNNEIIFDKSGRYGIEFDRDNDKKVCVTKTFGPATVGDVNVAFGSNKTAVPLLLETVAPGTTAYNELAWYLMNEKVINADDIKATISNNGWTMYLNTIEFEANDTFVVKSSNPDHTANADHLVSYTGSDDAIDIVDGYIKIKKAGTYAVGYSPCCDSIMINGSTLPKADAYAMVNSEGSFLNLNADNNGVVTYEGHFDIRGNIIFMDSGYHQIIPTFSSTTDTTVAMISSGVVVFNKAGTFKLELNINTSVLNIVIVSLDTVDPEDPNNFIFILSVMNIADSSDSARYNMTLSNGCMVANNVTAKQGNYFYIMKMNKDTFDSVTINALDPSVDASIASVAFGSYNVWNTNGTFTVSLNLTTELISISAVA